jgi:hypothetical protein
MPSLKVLSGPHAGKSYEVADALVFGREGADVVIDDAELSRRHLAVRRLPDGLEVEDLGSTNGTFVDGHRINATVRVGNGRQIRAGSSVFEVAGVAAAPAQPVSDADVTRQRPVAGAPQPAVTAQRAIPPQPAVTAQRAVPPQPAVTAQRAQPSAATEETAVRRPAAAPREDLAVAAFTPPAPRKGGGLASRSWVPVALSFGTVVATAIALVLYFYFQNN